jgi:hypothetical protein
MSVGNIRVDRHNFTSRLKLRLPHASRLPFPLLWALRSHWYCGMSSKTLTDRQVEISQTRSIETLTLVYCGKCSDHRSLISYRGIKANTLLGFDITSKIDPKTKLSFELYLHSVGNAVSQSSSVDFEPQRWEPCFEDNRIVRSTTSAASPRRCFISPSAWI